MAQSRILLLLGKSPRPGSADHCGRAYGAGLRCVFPVVFEVETQSRFLGHQDVRLHAGSMNGIVRDQAGRQIRASRDWVRYRALVVGDLPLVISNAAQLSQQAFVFFQGERLPHSPLRGECLAWSVACTVRIFPGSVKLPIREKIHACSLALRKVQRCSRDEVIAPIAGANVVTGARSVTTRRSVKRIGTVKRNSLRAPTQREWLNVGI